MASGGLLWLGAAIADAVSLPAENFVSNSSFESDASGWSGFSATVNRLAASDAPHGGYVARASWSGGPNTYTLDDDPDSVITGTQEGFDYKGTAWAKGNAVSAGKTLEIWVREWTPTGVFVGSDSSSITLSSSQYQEVSVTRTASSTGNTLDIYLARPDGTVVSGDQFLADAISLRLDDGSSCSEALGGFDVGSWPPACWRPYADTSPFNRLIPASSPVNPDSSAIVSDLVSAGDGIDDIVVGDPSQDYGNPTYYSRPADPQFTLDCTQPWGTCEIEGMQIRVPDQAKPAGGVPATPQWSTTTATPPFGNKTSNPSFETNTTGWESNGGSLARQSGGAPHGSWAVKVTRSGSSSAYTLDDSPDTVSLNALGGVRYAARAWVRGNAQSNGKPLEIWVREWTPGGGFVNSASASVTLSSSQYKEVEVVYTATADGNTVDTYLARPSAVVANDAFLADGFHLIKQRDHDAHMTIVDQATGWEYDLWNVTAKPQGGGTLQFGWGGRTRIGTDGDGLGSGGIAAGYGNLAGLIRAEELRAGVINHALVIAPPCVDGYVYPAAQQSGVDCTGLPIDDAPPLGALFQLDMTDSEIAALGLSDWERAIVRALAHYGAYVSDTTGIADSWGVEIENGVTYTSFGSQNPFFSLADELDLAQTDTNTNAPCPVPSMWAWEGNTPSECAAYGDVNDPGNTTLDEYRYELREMPISWSDLRVLDPCVAAGTC